MLSLTRHDLAPSLDDLLAGAERREPFANPDGHRHAESHTKPHTDRDTDAGDDGTGQEQLLATGRSDSEQRWDDRPVLLPGADGHGHDTGRIRGWIRILVPVVRPGL